MGLGVIASAFSFVKLDPLVQIIRSPPTDPTYQLFAICIWGQVELWIVMIALSIPSVWPLLKPCLEGAKSVASGNRTGRGTARTGLNSNKGAWKKVGTVEVSDPYKMQSLSSNANYSDRQPIYKSDHGGIRATTDVRMTTERREEMYAGSMV